MGKMCESGTRDMYKRERDGEERDSYLHWVGRRSGHCPQEGRHRCLHKVDTNTFGAKITFVHLESS